MAEAKDDFSERYADTFECSVCYALFENPRNLPCGHALCGPPKDCLSSLLETSHECPLCRRRFVAEQVKDFPINYPLISAIENLKKKSSAAKDVVGENRKREICREHNFEEEFYCRSCSICICKMCFVNHHVDDHAVTLFTKFIQEKVELCDKEAVDEAIGDESLKKIEEMYQKMLEYLPAMETGINLLKKEKQESNCLKDKIFESKSKSDLESNLYQYRVSITKAYDSLHALKLTCHDWRQVHAKFWSSLDVDKKAKSKLSGEEALDAKCLSQRGSNVVKNSLSSHSSLGKQQIVNNEDEMMSTGLDSQPWQVELSPIFDFNETLDNFTKKIRKAVCIHNGNAVVVLVDTNKILRIKINLFSFQIIQVCNVKLEQFVLFDLAYSAYKLYGLKNRNRHDSLCSYGPNNLCLCELNSETLDIRRTIDTKIIWSYPSDAACIAGNTTHLFLLVKSSHKLYIYKNDSIERVVNLFKLTTMDNYRVTEMHVDLGHLWIEYNLQGQSIRGFAAISYEKLQNLDVTLDFKIYPSLRPICHNSSSLHLDGIQHKDVFPENGKKREFRIYPNILQACRDQKPNSDYYSYSPCSQTVHDKDNTQLTHRTFFFILCRITEDRFLCCECLYGVDLTKFYLLRVT